MKTHGVKPVRVTVPQEGPAVQEPGEDSEDRDYTADGSQPTAGLPDEETRMGQRAISNTVQEDDAVDELALSPSPKTLSPHRHLRESSEQSQVQQTDNTSASEDNEFPDIRDLLRFKNSSKMRPPKRRVPPQSPISRKRIRTKRAFALRGSPSRMPADDWGHPPSPGHLQSTVPERNPASASVSTHQIASYGAGPPTPSPRPKSLPRSSRSPNAALILISSGESISNDEGASNTDGSAPETDSDMLRRTGKKIRGVLPASWLRLDQQTRKVASRKTTARTSPPRDPDQSRPGLATTKPGPSKMTASSRTFFDELNDDSEDYDTNATRTGLETPHLGQPDSLGDTDMLGFDDGASVIEEDCVDRMLPGKKRRTDLAIGRPSKRQRRGQNVFKEPAHKRYQQPKISQSFHRSGRSSSGTTRTRHPSTHQHTRRQIEQLMSPPALGIVDFIQPNAPNFIKIAARAARKRKDMGRSKPSHKNIDLGNRTDNVDALSVLTGWRYGKLRASSSMLRAPKRSHLQERTYTEERPLRPMSTNMQRQSDTSAKLSFTKPQKLTRQMNINHLTTSGGPTPQSLGQPSKATKVRGSTSYSCDNVDKYRPAQLEEDILQDTGVVFATRKKMLDLVFRRNRREILAPTFKLQQPTAALKRAPSYPAENIPHVMQHLQHDSNGAEGRGSLQSSKTTRRQPRKAAVPRRLNLEAPQFRHANDPLPIPTKQGNDEARNQLQIAEQSKIMGLGPFGTHYTQHFDVFPLHEDTYFHHSTLVGDGTLKKVLDSRSNDLLKRARPAMSFNIFDHHFRWDTWSDVTSSELGFLFDLLTEELDPDKVLGDSASQHQHINCANYILKYILQSARLHQEDCLDAFTQRLSNLLLGFLDSTKSRRVAHNHDRTLLEINVRFLMCSLMVLRFCRGGGELSSDCIQAESIVQQYARVVVQQLLESGFSAIRSLYDNLQRLSTRERGIRNNATSTISWVIVIKVLGSAQIPRAGFWDLTSSVMATTNPLKTNDVRKFEGLWEDMFTLLPLGEFDDMGVLSKGMRYAIPLQGWNLPQKLLKQIFDSYQRNHKQSPSFNEYCRALLARCHYLIEQWGWYKCVGVVGTIFDFFGHRYLSHLRNEEAYKSPDFLEELSGSPCLSVQPGDWCFHIFLKLLALAIQHLKRQGLSNDIRNLIARCLPNHNRQYSKEQTVHFDDLASLRNHHDLLCTLFWSAPPEDRRPVELIEKLVSPASSHKEACLINLRAWSQLARFVVSSGGSIEDYRPFMSWQNNMFQQILTQYLTAATDVQQQFMCLTKEKRKDIQQHMLDKIVASNQAAAKDILYVSVHASLEVMRHCPSLASATFSFNVTQMNKVFDKLVNPSIDLDWGVLRALFDTINSFVTRLEELSFQLKQVTGDSISSHDNRSLEDAIEFIDDKLVRGFFSAVRRALASIPLGDASQEGSPFQEGSPAVVVENAIKLCGRIASLFIDGGKRQIKHFFSPGIDSLFAGLPHEVGLAERKFVPLFVATLLKNHVFSFSSIGCSHFEIWILSLVKPFQALRYENYLAETLKMLDIGYVKGATVVNGAAPTYDANRGFFACGIAYIRRELRRADVAQRRSLRTKYEKLLKLVMQQMRTDIKSLELNSAGHQSYIGFIREIVGLIKSHGADICTIDPFYYQVSAEYSPAKEDPQLHTAGILAYGLRLEEGDLTTIPQLFHYLYNHFKSSLAGGQLEAEVKVVQNGMKDDNILAFIIGRMLPAIIQTSSQTPHVWPLLEVYSRALRDVLGRSHLPREIPRNQNDDVVMLLETVMDWFRRKIQDDTHASSRLTATNAHVFTELLKICNSVRPSLTCWLLLPVHDQDNRVQDCLDAITALASSTISYLDDLCTFTRSGTAATVHDVPFTDLLAGWKNTINSRFPPQLDSHVVSFTQSMERELRTNWVVTEDTITVRAAMTSAQPDGQVARGVKNDLDEKAELLPDLLKELRAWVDEIGGGSEDRNMSRKRRRRPRRFLDNSTSLESALYGSGDVI